MVKAGGWRPRRRAARPAPQMARGRRGARGGAGETSDLGRGGPNRRMGVGPRRPARVAHADSTRRRGEAWRGGTRRGGRHGLTSPPGPNFGAWTVGRWHPGAGARWPSRAGDRHHSARLLASCVAGAGGPFGECGSAAATPPSPSSCCVSQRPATPFPVYQRRCRRRRTGRTTNETAGECRSAGSHQSTKRQTCQRRQPRRTPLRAPLQTPLLTTSPEPLPRPTIPTLTATPPHPQRPRPRSLGWVR